jgi:uncharacterized protein (DUF427 family)
VRPGILTTSVFKKYRNLMSAIWNNEVNRKKNPDADWYHRKTNHAAKSAAGYVAFWKGVKVAA